MLLALVAVVLFNTLRLKAEPLGKAPPPLPVDAAAVQRLSQALQAQTVSTETGPASPEVFAAFHAFLAQSFPRIHALRPDKSVAEIDTVASVTALYEGLQQGTGRLVTAGHDAPPARRPPAS